MRKYMVYIGMTVFLLGGCVSAKKQMQKGNYDVAIRKSVNKLQRDPDNMKFLEILEISFTKANERDRERIEYLKKEGRPDIWDEVFSTYYRMKQRQTLVKTLTNIPPNLQFVNYDDEIIHAKQKAAEYFYVHGKKLLDNKTDRQSARQAYEEFLKVKSYYSDFKDVDELIKQAEFQGTSNVLFKMQNTTGIPLHPDFEREMLKITVADLSRKWLSYHLTEKKDLYYDYTVMVNIQTIDVAPEQVKEVHYTETKEVRDGWEYALDDEGNVMKDSLGNDIKKPKYKTIKANVIETIQMKKAMVGGTIQYLDNRQGEVVKSEPVVAETFFEHASALAIGDLNALSPETQSKISCTPIPFPTNEEMVLQSASILKGMTRDILVRNQSLLK